MEVDTGRDQMLEKTVKMKAAALVCVVLMLGVGNTKADFFDDLFAQVLKPTAEQLVQVGQNALLQLLQQGLISGLGKRGVDFDPVKLQAFLDKAKEVLGEKFEPLKETILEGYKELIEFAQNVNSLSWVNKGVTKRDLHNAVDMIVAKNQGKLRDAWTDLLGNLGNMGIGLLGQTVATGLGELQNILNQGVGNLGKRELRDAWTDLLANLGNMGIGLLGQTVQTGLGELQNLLNQNVGKRELELRDAWTDLLSNLGNMGIGLLGQTVQTGLGELQNLLNQGVGNLGKREIDPRIVISGPLIAIGTGLATGVLTPLINQGISAIGDALGGLFGKRDLSAIDEAKLRDIWSDILNVIGQVAPVVVQTIPTIISAIGKRDLAQARDAWTDLLANLGNMGIGLLGQTVQTGLGELQNLLNQGVGNLGKREIDPRIVISGPLIAIGTGLATGVLTPLINQGISAIGDALGGLFGKRDLSAIDEAKLRDIWSDILNVIGQVAPVVVQTIPTIISAIGKRDLGIDEAKLRGIWSDILNVIGQVAPVVVQTLPTIISAIGKRDLAQARDAWTDLLANLGNMGIGLLGQTVQTGLGELQNLLNQSVGKRDLTNTISTALQPHIDNAVAIAGQVGNTIQGHVNNLWNTVQSLGQLPDKLQTHVDTITGHVQNIIGHGTNAVSSIQDVVTDILNQTFQNIGSNVQGIVSTGGDAVNTAINHVSGGGN
ncbi:uncharacterized protein LOC135495028 [Lineus longissimus]|uniref:uncharacterized protein LOC135495028 n=1 Tax=Lineus longissimus TaxID=88925 RepID=UPI00315D7721